MQTWRLWIMLLSASFALLAENNWSQRLSHALEFHWAGNVVEAEWEFRAALGEARELGPESAALAHVLDAMDVFYGDIGNITEAEACYKRSLAIWRSRLGPEHLALAPVVNQLASLYIATGHRSKAEQLDLETWVRRLESVDPHSGNFVQLLENLASLESPTALST